MMSMALETPPGGAASVPLPPPLQSVTVRGTGDRSVTAWAPRSMTIRRGESAPLEIAIARVKFAGPVTVSLFQLPRGVAADRASLLAGPTEAAFHLKASRTADLVSHHSVGVTVEGPDGFQATQFVNVTVAV